MLSAVSNESERAVPFQPKLEAMGTEVNVVKMEVSDLIKNLDSWARPEKVDFAFVAS